MKSMCVGGAGAFVGPLVFFFLMCYTEYITIYSPQTQRNPTPPPSPRARRTPLWFSPHPKGVPARGAKISKPFRGRGGAGASRVERARAELQEALWRQQVHPVRGRGGQHAQRAQLPQHEKAPAQVDGRVDGLCGEQARAGHRKVGEGCARGKRGERVRGCQKWSLKGDRRVCARMRCARQTHPPPSASARKRAQSRPGTAA